MSQRIFAPGDWVVYSRTKHNTHPSGRARDIHPAPHGDDYAYRVDKFWSVSQVLPGGHILLQTPRGRTHQVDAEDPNLRHANWLERIYYRSRFLRSEAASPAV